MRECEFERVCECMCVCMQGIVDSGEEMGLELGCLQSQPLGKTRQPTGQLQVLIPFADVCVSPQRSSCRQARMFDLLSDDEWLGATLNAYNSASVIQHNIKDAPWSEARLIENARTKDCSGST